MTAREQHTAIRKEEYYHSSFNDEEQLDFQQALDVVGFSQEVALIRVKIKYILKNMPSNIILLLRAINSLETLIRLQQRDKQDSLAGIQKMMDTEFKGRITPGKPVTINLHELMAESTRTQSNKTASSTGGTSTVTNPPDSVSDTPPSPPAEKKPETGISAISEIENTPSPCTDVGLGACPDLHRVKSTESGQSVEFSPTLLVPAKIPAPHFHHSNSLFHRKKSRKKR